MHCGDFRNGESHSACADELRTRSSAEKHNLFKIGRGAARAASRTPASWAAVPGGRPRGGGRPTWHDHSAAITPLTPAPAGGWGAAAARLASSSMAGPATSTCISSNVRHSQPIERNTWLAAFCTLLPKLW